MPPIVARGWRMALLLWMLLAGGLFLWAPEPPQPPAVDPEEVAVWARTAARAEREAKAWQRLRGDLRIPWDRAEGHLAIVIDDIGRELHVMERLLALRHPLTFSVLPGSVYAAGAQLRLRSDPRRYREILLHLPMEPRDPAEMHRGREARESFLLSSDPPEVLRTKTERALDRVPWAIGVNNHMGSRLTTDRGAMNVVASVLRGRGLLFLDSRTSAETVAEQVAAEAGVPAIRRHVFLDHEPTVAAIDAALRRAVERSRRAPTIAIAHPDRAVVSVLERRLSALHEQGIGIYPLSQVLAHTGGTVPHL